MSVFIRLVDFKDSEEKERQFFNKKNWFTANQNDFQKIPGAPIAYWVIAYWVNENVMRIFQIGQSFYDFTISDGQNKTGDNEKYVREFWETNKKQIGKGRRWIFYAKGGGYRKWYGNLESIVDWSEKAREHYRKDKICRILPEYLWYQIGITWSLVTSNYPSFRILPSDATFDVGGSSLFLKNNDYLEYFLAFLNTKLTSLLVMVYNPTMNYQIRDIRNLPVILSSVNLFKLVKETSKSSIGLSKEEWDSRETSWDFQQNELLRHKTSGCIEEAYQNYCNYWREKFFQLHANEEELNRMFIEIYGLQEELTPVVELKDITILKEETEIGEGKSEKVEGKNWEEIVAQLHSPERRQALKERLKFKKEEIVKQFISYAVGCMFGRYSLDKPGLILANQGETLQDYLKQVPNPSFMPDADNIIPVLEDAYFTDDIVGRFQEFLKVSFGEAHFEENLRFIEDALSKSIRQYFVRDFYKDHIKRYKKRPIYWMFSSPKRGFNALIYMHRYRPDTVSRLLNEYLREFINKLEARQRHLKNIYLSESSSPRERKAADKELTRIERLLKELREYERNVLYPLAARKIEIDLDDGVKVNYCKFGEALYPIPGLCKEK
ncbi:MAG: BREX-1 system adenine-specific DNA-methyltransferase PglX [Candidatus Helarchaeota archaeon]